MCMNIDDIIICDILHNENEAYFLCSLSLFALILIEKIYYINVL